MHAARTLPNADSSMVCSDIKRPILKLKVDRAAPQEIHAQVAVAIRLAIDAGEALPGERLPSARDLAAELAVHPNTVLRALRQLRDEGLLEFRRGRGIRVALDAPAGELVTRTRALLAFARSRGHTAQEVADLIHRLA